MKNQRPNFMSKQSLTHFSAACFDCGQACIAKNAVAWAHNHVRRTGHRVELQLGYSVAPPRQEDQ